MLSAIIIGALAGASAVSASSADAKVTASIKTAMSPTTDAIVDLFFSEGMAIETIGDRSDRVKSSKALRTADASDEGYLVFNNYVDADCDGTHSEHFIAYGECIESKTTVGFVNTNSYSISLFSVEGGAYTFDTELYSDTNCSTFTSFKTVTYTQNNCTSDAVVFQGVQQTYEPKQDGINLMNYNTEAACENGNNKGVISGSYLAMGHCYPYNVGAPYGDVSIKPKACNDINVYLTSTDCSTAVSQKSKGIDDKSCGANDDFYADDTKVYEANEYSKLLCYSAASSVAARSFGVVAVAVSVMLSLLW